MPNAGTSKVSPVFALFLALAIMLVQLPAAKAATSGGEQFLTIGGSHLSYIVGHGDLSVSRADLAHYVKDAARAVIAYYGKFPVSKAVIHFVPSDDDGIGLGTSTFNDDEGCGVIVINIGESTSKRQLKESWTLTHELMHLSLSCSQPPHPLAGGRYCHLRRADRQDAHR